MTRDVFEKWLKDWDTQLTEQGRKACLLVDNCSAHHTDVPLKNIELKVLAAEHYVKTTAIGPGYNSGVQGDLQSEDR